MHAAPYIIVGYTLAAGVPNASEIIQDLDTEMPLGDTRFPFGVGNVCALKVTTANMHKCLRDVADFFTGMNGAHDDAITWFARRRSSSTTINPRSSMA